MEASRGECGMPSPDPKGAGAERRPAGGKFAPAIFSNGTRNAGLEGRRCVMGEFRPLGRPERASSCRAGRFSGENGNTTYSSLFDKPRIYERHSARLRMGRWSLGDVGPCQSNQRIKNIGLL